VDVLSVVVTSCLPGFVGTVAVALAGFFFFFFFFFFLAPSACAVFGLVGSVSSDFQSVSFTQKK
jgi:hypothetical protein